MEWTSLTSIKIPASYDILRFAFDYEHLKQIIGYSNTHAQSYANANNIEFISLGEWTGVEDSEEPVLESQEPATPPSIVTKEPVGSNKPITPPSIVTTQPIDSNKPATSPSVVTNAPVESTPPAVEISNVKGDANGDGVVTLADASFVLRVALLLSPVTDVIEANVDVDNNDEINLKDAQRILRAALLIEPFDSAKNWWYENWQTTAKVIELPRYSVSILKGEAYV